MRGVQVCEEAGLVVISLKEAPAASLAGKLTWSLGVNVKSSEIHELVDALPGDKPICLCFDDVAEPRAMAQQALPVFSALLAVLASAGRAIAVSYPFEGYGSFIVVSSEESCQFGSIVSLPQLSGRKRREIPCTSGFVLSRNSET